MEFIFIFGALCWTMSTIMAPKLKWEINPDSCEDIKVQKKDIANNKLYYHIFNHGGVGAMLASGIAMMFM